MHLEALFIVTVFQRLWMIYVGYLIVKNNQLHIAGQISFFV